MWLLPTLNRLEKLKVFLDSALAAETTTPGLILVDENDWKVNQHGYESLILPHAWIFRVLKGVSMGDKSRQSWPQLEGRKWVGILNDDHVVVTNQWDQKMLKYLDGTNFASANDRWM